MVCVALVLHKRTRGHTRAHRHDPARFHPDGGYGSYPGEDMCGRGHTYGHGRPSNPEEAIRDWGNVQVQAFKTTRKRSGATTSGRWTEMEHQTFLRGLNIYGRKW